MFFCGRWCGNRHFLLPFYQIASICNEMQQNAPLTKDFTNVMIKSERSWGYHLLFFCGKSGKQHKQITLPSGKGEYMCSGKPDGLHVTENSSISEEAFFVRKGGLNTSRTAEKTERRIENESCILVRYRCLGS